MNRYLLTFLLACGSVNTAHAMGLGDLSVRSALGQPFDATIQLIDPPSNLTADCFSVRHAEGNLPSLHDVRLALETRGTRQQLRLTAQQTLNEPLAEFVLVSDCESRLQRHYVALIDPMPMPVNEARGDVLAAEPMLPRATNSQPGNVAPVPRAPGKKRVYKRSSTQNQTQTPAPRLVLSGKRHTDSGNTAFALRLDTNLPDLSRPRGEPVTSDELSDENTALTRKLAHLEAQLAELAQKNAALDAAPTPSPRTQTAATPPAAVTPPAPARWPLYLLGLAAALAASAALIVWLRRRAQARDDTLSTPFFDDALPPTQDDHANVLEEIPTRQEVASVSPEPQAAAHYHYGGDSSQDEGTEVKEDLLDQAEVFMAHGHADLAIHLLKEHVQKDPTESPVPWLLLLDLLHRQGDSAEYAAAGDECRRYYNVNLTGHPISQEGEPPGPGLESYPHVLERLTSMWSTPELENFLHEMIHDSRGGTRMGFEPGAYRELLLLHEIAKDLKAA